MTQVLRGRIEPLGLVDVLAYLGRTRASGALNVEQDTTKKAIIISEGMIVFARSNQVQDRLGDILLAKNLITQEQFDQGTALIYEKGFRHGRALVEIGAISPKVLWETIQEQVKTIASSVIPWDRGSYEFISKDLKRKEAITLKWSILDMVQDIIRNLDDARMFRSRFPDLTAVYHVVEGDKENRIALEPYEAYILAFMDGQASLAEICAQSDYGEAESLRVIYLLECLGWVERTMSEDTLPPIEPDEIHPMITCFNRVFAFSFGYIRDRVGPVGTNLLTKYYEDVAASQPILAGVAIQSDGSLDVNRLQNNMNRTGTSEDERTMLLDEAMNEYLNAGILAVKKVLGTEHETAVVEKIGEILGG